MGDELSSGARNKLRRSFRLAASDEIFAYADTTPLGFWRTGVVLSASAIVFQNPRFGSDGKRYVIDWESLFRIPHPVWSGANELRIGDFAFYMETSSFPAEKLVRLTIDLINGLQEMWDETAGEANGADRAEEEAPESPSPERLPVRVVDY